MNYTSMERRNVKVLRDMGQKMGESKKISNDQELIQSDPISQSRIFYIQAILNDCSTAKSTRSRESRIPITRLSKMTSDM